MDADRGQPLGSILRGPRADVGQRAEPVDAGAGPEVDEDDASAKSLRRNVCHDHRHHAYLIRSAALSASSRAASLNGLARHSTAPCARRRGRTVLSPLAVMKTIGIF